MLRVENLFFSHKEKIVLEDISFNVQAGEVILLVGENGCGKSTLLYLLAGLYSPNSGHISIEQKEYQNNKTFIREKVGMMFQEPIGFKGSTVLEIIHFFRALNYTDSIIEGIIDLTKIKPYLSKKVESLSGGEKQKVALAISLIGGADYILLDEPISALDVRSRQEFVGVLQELKRRGTSIIITSHILEELRNIADKVLYIKEHKICKFVETESLISRIGYTHKILLKGDKHSFSLGYRHYINDNRDTVIYCRNYEEVDEIYNLHGSVGTQLDRVSLDDIFYLIGD